MADTRIDELRQRLERDPGSRLFAHLAEELRKAGEVEEAISVARAGLEQHPSYPSARLTLGRALLDAGDAAAARAELETAVRGAPDNILASRMLGEALERQGDLEAALVRYRATLEMAPGDGHVEARVRAVEERLGGTRAAAGGAGHEATTPLAAAHALEERGTGGSAVPPGADGELPPTVRIPPPPDPRGQARAPLPPTTGATRGDADGFPTPSPPGDPVIEEPLPPTLSLGARTAEVRAEQPPVVRPQEPRAVAGGARQAPAFGTDTAEVGEAAGEMTGMGGEPAGVLDAEGGDRAPAGEGAASTPAGAGGADPGQPPLSSATLGELYFQQGLLERAVDVYRQVLEEEPGNELVRRRLAEIEKVAGEPAGDRAVPTSEEKDERAVRRRALERAIERLEALLAVVRGGR